MKPNVLLIVLLMLNALLGGALAMECLQGPSQLQWPTPDSGNHAPRPSAVIAPLVPLPETPLAQAWEHPLFSPDRQPDLAKASAGATPLAGVALSGVILQGDARWALLRSAAQQPFKLKLGEALGSGWVLQHLTATGATFVRQGQTQTLDLPVLRLPAQTTVPLIKLPHVTAP